MGLGVVVVVTAKLPLAGEVKTRLGKMLDREQRAALQAALLGDALAKARLIGKAYLSFAPAEAVEEAATYPLVEVFPQRGADLGERMANAIEEVFSRDPGPVLLLGTDCPYLSVEDLREAAAQLEEAEVCLGPALDGGYYLIGLRRPGREVFANVPWGSPLTLAATIARLLELGLSYRLIRPLPDVDTPSDLLALIRAASGRGRWRVHSPQLCALLRSWYLGAWVSSTAVTSCSRL